LDKQVEAILNLFGTYTGGGLFNTADLHSFLGFDVGLRVNSILIPREFKEVLKSPLSGVDVYPLPLVQLNVGLLGNLEVTGRMFYLANLGEGPSPDGEGNVKLVGIGLKYGLLQKPLLPKVAVMAAYHALIVPEEFDFGTVNTISLKGIVSKGVPGVTVYAGAGVDRTTLRVENISPAKNYHATNVHGTAGLSITLIPLLRLNAEYNLGEFRSINLGAGLSIR